jgi:hypothetical protein
VSLTAEDKAWFEDALRRALGTRSPVAVAATNAVLGGEGQGSAPAPAQRELSGTGPVFPPYGRSKGQPVHGAARGDLEFYRNGCLRSLADPAKARWHDKERTLLAAIEAEIARQSGSGTDAHDPTASWGDPPPRTDGPPPGFEREPGDDSDVGF